MTPQKTQSCFGIPMTREMVEKTLQKNARDYEQYQSLKGEWKEKFLNYCMGKTTLPFTYDPFFKKIFNPEIYPERLSGFISSILGQKVKVVKSLPVEEIMIDGDALLIMDILVELADGSLTNIEIQKMPYYFSGERMSCYSADLLLRQYSKLRGEKGQDFSYRDIKKVYTIILYEKSSKEFHVNDIGYIHHGKIAFDTDLKMDLMQEYHLVALDVFRKYKYDKRVETNELNGWLSFLATDDVDEAEELLEDYPWLEAVYRDSAQYMQRPGEVLSMFSEALKIMDRNTVQYMIDDMQNQLCAANEHIEELTQEREEFKRECSELKQEREDMQNKMQHMEAEITMLKELIEGLKK